MAKYLLVSSRDPFEVKTVPHTYGLARGLVQEGNEVTLFLVQNGVLPARQCEHSAALSEVANAGVEVLADDFSLRERGISSERLAEGVRSAPLDVVIDGLASGSKTLWH